MLWKFEFKFLKIMLFKRTCQFDHQSPLYKYKLWNQSSTEISVVQYLVQVVGRLGEWTVYCVHLSVQWLKLSTSASENLLGLISLPSNIHLKYLYQNLPNPLGPVCSTAQTIERDHHWVQVGYVLFETLTDYKFGEHSTHGFFLSQHIVNWKKNEWLV